MDLLVVFAAHCAAALPAAGNEFHGRAAAPPCHMRSAPAMPAPPSVYLLPYPYQASQGVNLPRQTYSYGWFGASPRHHRGVHYGYYGNYTQWSFR